MSHIRNIMHIHAKRTTDTLSHNYWLVKASASSACPTATSWWPLTLLCPAAAIWAHWHVGEDATCPTSILQELHRLVLGYKLRAAPELSCVYLRHEAKPEQSETWAFYLINLPGIQIESQTLRCSSYLKRIILWFQCFNMQVRKCSYPTTLTSVLTHLQHGTKFWWKRKLKRKTSQQCSSSSRSPQSEVSHCRLLLADLGDLHDFLNP